MRRRQRFKPAVITGNVDWRDLVTTVQPERLHDRHQFRERAHDLAALGLDVGAIARALGLRRQAVKDLLGEPVRDARGRPRRVAD